MALSIRTLVLIPVLATLGACGGGSDSGMSQPLANAHLGPTNTSGSASTSNGGGSAKSGAGGGTSGTSSPTGDYTIGGTAGGVLGGGFALQLNSGAALPVATNGAFTFPGAIASGSSYLVTIDSQPSNPSQTCVLSGASGTVAGSAITNVIVTCTSAPTQFAYGSGSGIYCFAVNAGSNALVPLAQPQCDSGELAAVAADPAGPYVYATDGASVYATGAYDIYGGSVRMYQVDSATGQLVPLSAISAEPSTSEYAFSITVDPSGRFVYAGGYGNIVSGFAIDPSTGLLTDLPGSPFAAGGGYINALVTDPSGKFLYTANTTTQDVSAFAIDATTGSLTPVPGSPFAVDNGAQAIVVDPAGRFVFVANLDVSVFTIDDATGVLSPATGSPFTIPCPYGAGAANSLAIDASGAFLYAVYGCPFPSPGTTPPSYVWGFAIDSSTGALTALSGSPLISSGLDPSDPSEVSVRGEALYVSNSDGTVSMFGIDEMTGALTQISGSPVASGSNDGLYSFAFAP